MAKKRRVDGEHDEPLREPLTNRFTLPPLALNHWRDGRIIRRVFVVDGRQELAWRFNEIAEAAGIPDRLLP